MVWNVMNHPTYDEFWKLRNPDFSKIQVPVFVVGALHKVGLHLRGVVRGYEEVRTPKKMMLIHGVMDGDEMAIYNSPEMQLLMLRWYDHWLKGNDTGFMDEPPVTMFVRGADEYRPYEEWPLPQTEYRRLYFNGPRAARSTSRSTTAASRGIRRPKRTAPSPTAIRTGLDPLLRRRHAPSSRRRHGPLSRGASRPSSASRSTRTCEVSGSIVLVLYASSDQRTRTSSAVWWTRLPDDRADPGHAAAGLTS